MRSVSTPQLADVRRLRFAVQLLRMSATTHSNVLETAALHRKPNDMNPSGRSNSHKI
jgi:hypothetical protein